MLLEAAPTTEILGYVFSNFVMDSFAIQEALLRAQAENEQLRSDLEALENKYKQLLETEKHKGETSSENRNQKPEEQQNGTQSTESVAVDETTTAANKQPSTVSTFSIRKTFADVTSHLEKDRGAILEEHGESYERITHQLRNIPRLKKDPQSLVMLVADCLPHVIPGVLLKKREELIPLILCAIGQHPDSAVRYKLTQSLFELIKKPNDYERQMIVDGFIALANITSEAQTETELLPQW